MTRGRVSKQRELTLLLSSPTSAARRTRPPAAITHPKQLVESLLACGHHHPLRGGEDGDVRDSRLAGAAAVPADRLAGGRGEVVADDPRAVARARWRSPRRGRRPPDWCCRRPPSCRPPARRGARAPGARPCWRLFGQQILADVDVGGGEPLVIERGLARGGKADEDHALSGHGPGRARRARRSAGARADGSPGRARATCRPLRAARRAPPSDSRPAGGSPSGGNTCRRRRRRSAARVSAATLRVGAAGAPGLLTVRIAIRHAPCSRATLPARASSPRRLSCPGSRRQPAR